jgi:hypothetical protein
MTQMKQSGLGGCASAFLRLKSFKSKCKSRPGRPPARGVASGWLPVVVGRVNFNKQAQQVKTY